MKMKQTYYLFLLTAVLSMLGVNTSAADNNAVAYARLANDGLTFYYDANITDSDYPVTEFQSADARGWNDYAGSARYVEFDESFAGYSPTSTAYWFSGMSMIESLDLTNLNMANVTNADGMFQNCILLATITVNNTWPAAESAMTPDGSNSGVSGSYMFNGCRSLVGGAGTTYDAQHIDYSYAHIDGGVDNPGYFTDAAGSAEAYAAFNSDYTVLTFYYDNQKASRSGMDLGPFPNADYRGWNGYASNITKVVFDSSMDSYTDLTSTAFWFWEFTNLEEVVDIKYLHTDNVTSMESMFGIWGGTGSTPYTGKLPAVDMTHFNTSKVINMSGVFSNCAALTTLDLSSFDTSSVTDMSTIFSGCTGLTTIYVGSGWTTANVTNGSIMFQDCTSLVGGAGTTYDENNIDHTYARIDGGPNSQTPGYFTAKSTASNLEIFSVDKTVTYVPNQSITPTPSITMTPGNDAEWLTDLAIGLTNTTTGESDDPLQFTASIYYPNSTETFSYLDAMRGTLNPRDGDLTTNAETGAIDNTGTQYIPGYNNVPRSGGFIAYEALQDGSLIIPIRVTSNKSLFVVEDDGHVKTDIQFKDADGNTLTLGCAER